MNVLVTGATGHLGFYACRTIAEAGHAVRATDREFRADPPVRVEIADLLDPPACYRLTEGVEAVVHLGNHPAFRGRDAQRVFNENMAMNMNVFQAAADIGVKKIIFASSVQVISGNRDEHEPHHAAKCPPYLPMDGDVPPNPGNPYALSKQLGELMLAYFARQTGIVCVAIRFPWLVNDDHLAWIKANPPRSIGDRGEGFTFLHFQDAASLLQAVLRVPLTGFRVYFPASRDNRLCRPPTEVIREHFADTPLRRPLEQIDSLVDLSGIERETGWLPKFSTLT
jgi:nucleoside-diphosphate-sugar epimerase